MLTLVERYIVCCNDTRKEEEGKKRRSRHEVKDGGGELMLQQRPKLFRWTQHANGLRAKLKEMIFRQQRFRLNDMEFAQAKPRRRRRRLRTN